MHQSYLKSLLKVKLTWKKCKKSFFIIEKIKKYRKCPALPTAYPFWGGGGGGS